MQCKGDFFRCVEIQVRRGDLPIFNRCLKLDFPNRYKLSAQKTCGIKKVVRGVHGHIEWNLNFLRNLND